MIDFVINNWGIILIAVVWLGLLIFIVGYFYYVLYQCFEEIEKCEELLNEKGE